MLVDVLYFSASLSLIVIKIFWLSSNSFTLMRTMCRESLIHQTMSQKKGQTYEEASIISGAYKIYGSSSNYLKGTCTS